MSVFPPTFPAPDFDHPGASPDDARRVRRRRLGEAFLIAAVALTLNLAGNGRTTLWDRDEPRYAGCTREMRARGDWLFPTFNGEPRYHKPVLIYWLMRGGYAVAGENPFGARLPSALAGTATSLLVLGIGRRWFGPGIGFLAALMLTTAPIMVVESKLATTDATLCLFLVGTQACVWSLSQRDDRRVAAAFWALLALAVLTKGPVGPALVACAGVVSWWWGGPTACWRRLHWKWGVPLFLAVAAPWYVAIGVASGGDFYRFAVGKQIAERVTTGMEQHGGFPGYYLVTSLVTFHPWSALLPAAGYAAWRRRRDDPRLGFLLGWVVGPLILLEAVRTKLVHYYLPAYPACALLGAWFLAQLAAEGVNVRRWPLGGLALGLLGGVGLGVAAVLGAGAVVVPGGMKAPCVVAAAVVAGGTVWGLHRFRQGATARAVGGLAAAWGLVMLTVGGWLLPSAEPYRMTRVVGEKLAQAVEQSGFAPVLLSFQEPTVVYTMGRPAPMIRTWPQFYELLDRHKSLVTAMIDIEMAEFAKRADHLDVQVTEVYRGFNLNKGETQTLQFAVIRRKPAPADHQVGRAASEKVVR